MKLSFSLRLINLSVFFICLLLVSCSKDDPQETTKGSVYPVPGLWEGAYLTDQTAHQPAFASFAFYSDGTVIFRGKGVPPAQTEILAKGKWTLNNHDLTYTDTTLNYTSAVIQTGKFYYDSTKNILTNGIWQNHSSDNGQIYSGTFPTMQKR